MLTADRCAVELRWPASRRFGCGSAALSWTSKAVLAALALACAGCVSTVVPPAEVREPVTVHLVREGLHQGLVMPGEAGYVEYGYGEWRWYALGNDAWYDVFDTVLWPTRGTLGRREIPAGGDAELRERRAPGRLTALVVERGRMIALRERLAADFERGSADAVRRGDVRTTFVPAERRFWFGHNCHDAVAKWLRELDCKVGSVPVRTGLKVERSTVSDQRSARSSPPP